MLLIPYLQPFLESLTKLTSNDNELDWPQMLVLFFVFFKKIQDWLFYNALEEKHIIMERFGSGLITPVLLSRSDAHYR